MRLNNTLSERINKNEQATIAKEVGQSLFFFFFNMCKKKCFKNLLIRILRQSFSQKIGKQCVTCLKENVDEAF